MGKIGFDNDKYLAMQSAHIRERISKFGGKLYLEFGGKLFDDFHASRVLPGFQPDSKIRMLQQLRDDAEIVIAVNANDIEKNKVRGDLGITYDDDCLRLIDAFRSLGSMSAACASRSTRGRTRRMPSSSVSTRLAFATTATTPSRAIPPTSPTS